MTPANPPVAELADRPEDGAWARAWESVKGAFGGGGKPNPSAILRSVEALGNQAPGRPKSR